jgi:hypothetical protein
MAEYDTSATTVTYNGGAGGIFVLQYGAVVMTGGEISNNTMDVNGKTPKAAMAGGLMAGNWNNQRYANASIFMTGGEISGNEVKGSSEAVASAGGVFAGGTFQKNGGTIYGADAGETGKRNITSLTGNKASAVFIASGPSISSGTPTTVQANVTARAKREDTAGPEITLFTQAVKSTNSGLATTSVPTWATSYWDQ